MPDSLLSTKLNIPRIRHGLVHRPRLVEKLNVGLQCKLTAVSAPAGYGKTTLVAQWLAELRTEESARNSAWLSLEEADNELPRFFSYLIAALQKLDPSVGVEVQSILETEADVRIEPLLTALVNDIAAPAAAPLAGQQFVLCLDDYHVITEFKIHEALDFLIDHIPPRMHLIIIGRTDPPMPLGRLRVQRELTEIRETDIQFTIDETTTFFNDTMGFTLSNEDIESLGARTEGWIAGLQLAALTLQGRHDQSDRVNAIAGSHRHLIDYLAHEVLSRQSEEVQSFLMRISILDRFNASLCDKVLEQRESLRILEYLEQAHLFLVPLDNERRWYRFHNLFADFLRQRLKESRPESISVLFNRASQWYEAQDEVDEAIQYAFRSGDVEQAAKLLDEYAEVLILLYADVVNVLQLAGRIPEEVRANFPRLCIYHAWALQFEYQLDSVESTLALAEAHLSNPAGLPENFSAGQLKGHANAIRAYTAMRRGNYIQALDLCNAVLKALPEEDTKEVASVEGAVQIGLGMAYLELGRVEDAYEALKRAIPLNQRAGNRYGFLSSINVLMQVDAVRGTLKQAHANGEKGLMWIEEWSATEKRQRRPSRMLAYFRFHMGIVQYEWNELNEAAKNLQKACDYYSLVQSWHRFACQAFLVDLHQAFGDMDRAWDTLRELQRLSLTQEHSFHNLPLAAWIAERSLLLSQSRQELRDLFAEAVMWAENSGLDPNDAFRSEQEYEYATLAKVLIAQDRGEQAIPLVDRLIQSAESAGRWGNMIAYLSIQATAHHSLGNRDLALAHLSRAMTLAEPEGYIRTFVDLGPAMHDLLKIVTGKYVSTIYTARLLVAFPTSDEKTSLSRTRPSFPQDTAALTEPLNDREMQILRLMSARLSNREIADELHLSVNTVKWYASSIYVKLGVANRREAGSRARDLRFL